MRWGEGGGKLPGHGELPGRSEGGGGHVANGFAIDPPIDPTLTAGLGHVHAAPIAFAGYSNLFHALGAPTSLTDDDDDDDEKDGDEINPITAPGCTFSGLKSVYIHACKQYI